MPERLPRQAKGLTPRQPMWRGRISAGSRFLNAVRALHRIVQPPRQNRVATGFGLHAQKRAHGGDLILVLLHAPGEGAAVFCADQCLRRTDTLSHVGHVEMVCVYDAVEMAAALFPDTKAVNTLRGIGSEGP